MENPTFDTFIKKIYIAAPKAKIYDCWATSQEIESWFLSKAVFKTKEGSQRSGGIHLARG